MVFLFVLCIFYKRVNIDRDCGQDDYYDFEIPPCMMLLVQDFERLNLFKIRRYFTKGMYLFLHLYCTTWIAFRVNFLTR